MNERLPFPLTNSLYTVMTGIVQNWGLYSEYKMWCKCGITRSKKRSEWWKPVAGQRKTTKSTFSPFHFPLSNPFTLLLFSLLSPYFSLLLFSSLVQTAVLHTPLHASSHSHPFTPILIHKTTKTERGTNTFQTLPNPPPQTPLPTTPVNITIC